MMSAKTTLTSFALAGALPLVSLGCGGSEAAAPVQSAAAAPKPTIRTTIYFLADDGAAPVGVRRTIERKSPYAREALEALLAGPTAAERKRRLTTGLPSDARLLSLTLKGPGSSLAIVNLTGLPPAQGRQVEAGSLGMRLRVITQVARTLIGLSGIERVELKVDGKPWDLWTMKGGIVRATTDYERLRGWTRVCGGRSAEERELGVSRCFSALP